jgi:PTH1 family peptidyl-tRNA hydrolase
MLAKPLTYMNRSGAVLPALLRLAGNDRLLVICDSLDLPPGSCRLKRRGSLSGAGHKGLASIISVLGHGDFMRLYIGVGHPGSREEVVSYVLGEPGEQEIPLLAAAEKQAAAAALRLLTVAPEGVMHAINRKQRL